MRGIFDRWPTRYCFLTGALVSLFASGALAQRPESDRGGDQHRPVYQRRASEWKDHHRFDKRHARPNWTSPPVSSGWFQRPYPYHLDYYKMRYGGSYAPYFGNLYGPPQVVTAPPYFGPYYGGFEPGNPNAFAPNGMMYGAPADGFFPANQPQMPPYGNGNELPSPQ